MEYAGGKTKVRYIVRQLSEYKTMCDSIKLQSGLKSRRSGKGRSLVFGKIVVLLWLSKVSLGEYRHWLVVYAYLCFLYFSLAPVFRLPWI